MPNLSYLKALNRAIGDEMDRDPAVCVFGEDVGVAVTHATAGLLKRFGPDRVLDTPISEQAFTSFATGAAMAGLRPLIEFQIPALLFLVFEQIANQAHKFSLMTGGQTRVPVTYLLPGSGSRDSWAGQHSDHPYSLFAHVGVKTVVPATAADAYGLLVTAIRDDDPVVVFAPSGRVTRRGGAISRISSAAVARISPPMPQDRLESSTTTSRPVRSSDAARPAQSKGCSERGSNTSTETDPARSSATARASWTRWPTATTVTSVPGRRTRAEPSGTGPSSVTTSSRTPSAAAGAKRTTGSSSRIAEASRP